VRSHVLVRLHRMRVLQEVSRNARAFDQVVGTVRTRQGVVWRRRAVKKTKNDSGRGFAYECAAHARRDRRHCSGIEVGGRTRRKRFGPEQVSSSAKDPLDSRRVANERFRGGRSENETRLGLMLLLF